MAKKERVVRPSIERIVRAQRKLIETLPNVEPDLAGCHCWACGIGPDEDGTRWRPDRAHLIPRSSGGGLEPSNFILLCHMCHAEQPDAAPLNAQLEWLRQRDHWLSAVMRRHSGFAIAFQAKAAEIGPDRVGGWLNAIGGYPGVHALMLASRSAASNAVWGVLSHLTTWAETQGRSPDQLALFGDRAAARSHLRLVH